MPAPPRSCRRGRELHAGCSSRPPSAAARRGCDDDDLDDVGGDGAHQGHRDDRRRGHQDDHRGRHQDHHRGEDRPCRHQDHQRDEDRRRPWGDCRHRRRRDEHRGHPDVRWGRARRDADRAGAGWACPSTMSEACPEAAGWACPTWRPAGWAWPRHGRSGPRRWSGEAQRRGAARPEQARPMRRGPEPGRDEEQRGARRAGEVAPRAGPDPGSPTRRSHAWAVPAGRREPQARQGPPQRPLVRAQLQVRAWEPLAVPSLSGRTPQAQVPVSELGPQRQQRVPERSCRPWPASCPAPRAARRGRGLPVRPCGAHGRLGPPPRWRNGSSRRSRARCTGRASPCW